MPRQIWTLTQADVSFLIDHAINDAKAIGVAVMREHGGGGPAVSDPIGALAALMGPEGRLSKHCSFCYELRLHRARGYGARAGEA